MKKCLSKNNVKYRYEFKKSSDSIHPLKNIDLAKIQICSFSCAEITKNLRTLEPYSGYLLHYFWDSNLESELIGFTSEGSILDTNSDIYKIIDFAKTNRIELNPILNILETHFKNDKSDEYIKKINEAFLKIQCMDIEKTKLTHQFCVCDIELKNSLAEKNYLSINDFLDGSIEYFKKNLQDTKNSINMDFKIAYLILLKAINIENSQMDYLTQLNALYKFFEENKLFNFPIMYQISILRISKSEFSCGKGFIPTLNGDSNYEKILKIINSCAWDLQLLPLCMLQFKASDRHPEIITSVLTKDQKMIVFFEFFNITGLDVYQDNSRKYYIEDNTTKILEKINHKNNIIFEKWHRYHQLKNKHNPNPILENKLDDLIKSYENNLQKLIEKLPKKSDKNKSRKAEKQWRISSIDDSAGSLDSPSKPDNFPYRGMILPTFSGD